MKPIFIIPFLFAATASQAQINPFDASQTLSQTQARLENISDKSGDQYFALGAVHFLRGIEKTLQTRWQYNATIDGLPLPVLRLPVAPNPNAMPFRADLVTGIFADLLVDMEASRTALGLVEGEVALRINLQDLWFDINMNNRRDAGEGVMEVGAAVVMGPRQARDAEQTPANIKVQFDTADVAWLTAYTHLLSGISELVLAFDPTEAIDKVMKSSAEMDTLRGRPFSRTSWLGAGELAWIDQFAMVYGALNMQPDASHTRAAHAQFLDMIAENKVFWAEVALEGDDQMEWIPNENQQSALGIEMPEGVGIAWQAILEDAEAILNGELLVIHWRLSDGAGINVKEMFMNPPVVDIVTWVQGAGLLPYMERGPVATSASMRAFERLVSGNSIGFAFLLN